MELKPKDNELTTAIAEGINRTFMELKLGYVFCISGLIPVLIEPLWNWNT